MSTRPVYSMRFKVVATVLLTVVTALLVGAYLATDRDDDGAILQTGGPGDVVEELIPDREAQVVQQSTIGIDLAVGWSATLTLNGSPVPEDQLSRTPELALIEFTPGEGQVVEQLPPGRNCLTADIWSLAEGRDAGTRPVSWCFTAV